VLIFATLLEEIVPRDTSSIEPKHSEPAALFPRER
jgi:hypothetical protein